MFSSYGFLSNVKQYEHGSAYRHVPMPSTGKYFLKFSLHLFGFR